ncbi:MAG: TolC family protein [Myxococcaceae bacterium]|nr:TolC family protein [Myxococcaceae bacterium]
MLGVVGLVGAVLSSVPALELSKLPDDGALAALVWERATDLQLERVRLAQAKGDADRAHLLPNPGLDVSLNTIPLGTTNPPGLSFGEVPNVAIGLSEQVELFKRGPRQAATGAALTAEVQVARDLVRQRWLDLLDGIAEIATAQARTAELTELVKDAAELTRLQVERAKLGDTAALDADRAALEEEKLRAQLATEQSRLQQALAQCAVLAGVPCHAFESAALASAYLERRWALAGAELEQRPDLEALRAQEASARAAVSLANAHAIPDPTLRVGYVRDQFVVSGNQQNSLFVGVSLPLTFFDRGQTDAAAYERSALAAASARALGLEQAKAQLSAVQAQRATAEARRVTMAQQSLPTANRLVDRLEAAVQRGAAPVQDLIFARRSLGELTLDARDLDLFTFRLAQAEVRLRGLVPPMPQELSP